MAVRGKNVVILGCLLVTVVLAGAAWLAWRSPSVRGSLLGASRIKVPEIVLLEDFQRPLDRDLTAQFLVLERTGVAQMFEGEVLKPFFDDVQTARFNVEGVEVRPSQFTDRPEIQKAVDDCTRILKMAKPRLYVVNESKLNAYTTSFKEPTIILSSGLLEKFSDERELRFIIGREMGHIQCGHVKWQMVLRGIVQNLRSNRLVPDTLTLAPFLPVFKWAREAEMSADNAGLICCQDRGVAEQALVRLVHGSSEQKMGRVNVDAFLDQSANQEVSKFAEVIQYWKELMRGQPFVPDRIRQLREYAQSRQYQHLWE